MTPRQQQQPLNTSGGFTTGGTPSPTPKISNAVPERPTNFIGEIYLPEYCPLTLKAVQANKNHLDKFRDYAAQLFDKELDEMGINAVSVHMQGAFLKEIYLEKYRL